MPPGVPDGYYSQPTVRRPPTKSVEAHMLDLGAKYGLIADAITTEATHVIRLKYPADHPKAGQVAAQLTWSRRPMESAAIDVRARNKTQLEVAPELRRRGIATAMADVAIVLSEEHGWTRIRHTEARTVVGDLWRQNRMKSRGEDVW